MDKTNIRKILTSVLAVLLIFSMFTKTAFALSGDGSHIGHTGGGSSVSGAYLVPTSNSDHHVGFRFTWLTLGTDGYYSRKAALDVFYKGYNPNSSWGYHIKATVNGTTYRNLSKYEYKRYYDSLTIDREYFSTSTAYKYCNRTDIPVTLPADEDAMTTWGKKEANMNIILNKMVSGATVANMKSSDFIFIEPIYRVKIENTNYCITVTEMGLIGCVVCSATSTGNEGTGYGSGWVTIRRYTNLNWPDALKTDSAHAGISAGTTLSSATSFQNLVNKGYGLMVVWNTNPHLLTVYYTTGTGDASLKISSSYKLASNFSSYSSSYIRNSSDNYFTQSVFYDNNLTLMNGAGSGFNMTRDYYTFSKWLKNGTTTYFNGGTAQRASALNSDVATGNAEVTFTAVWTPKEYTITYNLNGGKIGTSSTNPTQKYTYETDVYIGNYSSGATAYSIPSRDGYDFAGWKYTGTTTGYWTKDMTYTNKYHKGTMEHGNITLYAQWAKKTYTVTYNANGGTGAPAAQTKTHGVDLTLSSAKPTKDGYDFVSWNTKSDGSGTTYKSGAKYTANANLTLYAQWSKKTYTVTYNANGGTGTPAAQTKTHGTDLTLSSTKPTRDGYDFTGWNTKSDGSGTAYASGGKYTKNESVTLYAQWKLKTYTVTYNANGGSGAPSAQTKTHGTDLTLSSAKPTRDGYDFTGWNTAENGSGTAYAAGGKYTKNANVTLYAQWKIKTYTVTYNANGGTNAPSAQTKTHGVDLTLSSSKATRVGYGFSGWNTNASGTGTSYAPGAKYTKNENITLYAQWKLNTYTVSYDANGGKGAPSDQTKKHGTDLTLSTTKPTREGYSFANWNTQADGKGTSYSSGGKYTGNADLMLYALWTPITYSIKFSGNGSTSGTMANQSFTYDKEQVLTANAFKREYTVTYNYNGNGTANSSAKATATFNGWATSSSGKVEYANKQNVKNLSSSNGAVINLYANWTDGSVTLPTPARTGYVFDGWYTSSSSGTKIGSGGGSYTPSKDITVYAHWTPISYTIKFNGNNATSGTMSNLSMTYDVAKTLTANVFKRTGYTYVGWNTKADGTGAAYTDKQSVKNLTTTNGATINLYAQWTPIGYSVKFNGNGSTSGSMANQSFIYDIAQNLTANAFKREFTITYNYNYTGKTNTTAKATAAFTGWATSASGSVVYTDKHSVKNLSSTSGAIVNVYAKWSDAKAILPTPTRTGYTFDGWYTTATGGSKIGGGGSSYTTDKDITVYAHWTPITYTIKFDGNKATSGTMANLTMTYDVAKNLTANAYMRTGYTFSGWNTAADGKGTAYADKQSVKNLTTTDKATITLYAQWKPISYTIRFDGNGAVSGSMSDLAMTYDVEKTLTANAFVKNAAEFIKWNTKADGTGTDYADKQGVKNLTTENGKVITLYAQWKNSRELSLEAITPNAAYRESTDVITSFNLVNKGEGACLPTDNVSVVFKVYKDSTAIKTVTQTGVVVPGNEKNLLFFKWTVPTNLGSSKIYVSGEIVENGNSYGLIKNQYTTCKYNVYATPDTQYEASAPDGFTVPRAPTAKSDTAKWSVWTYENNAFKKLNYGMAISDAAATIMPDESANAEQQGGVWVMKSGYGFGIMLNNGIKTLSGYSAAPSAAYTNSQYALALFPEFGYAQTNNNCRTLELVSGKWSFRENSDYGRIHFTPLWYPDDNYTAAVLQSDCWTPVGMITRMSNTNTITISGSAYDDWYVG